MSLRNALLPALLARGLAGLLFVACGGSTAAAGGDGRTADDGGSCSIPPGTYVKQYTARAGETGCAALPSESLTIGENGTPESSPPDASRGIAGCGTSLDSSTCTITTSCGGAGLSTETITFDGRSATGTFRPAGTSACTYDVTVTEG